MNQPSHVLWYVKNPEQSAAFYAELLGKKPVEQHPTFAMFAFDSGLMLGLWSRDTVEPAAHVTGGGGELAYIVNDVDAVYADWSRRGLHIEQRPTQMEFGYTCVVCDPDGHRLRAFKPGTP